MLSSSTLQLLDEVCSQSHLAYPEGGALWTYVEAANQAHTRFKDARSTGPDPTTGTNGLAKWFQWAVGDRDATQRGSVEAATRLVASVRRDLSFDDLLLLIEEGGSDMRAVLHMARYADNRYFSLDLWWSED